MYALVKENNILRGCCGIFDKRKYRAIATMAKAFTSEMEGVMCQGKALGPETCESLWTSAVDELAWVEQGGKGVGLSFGYASL